VRVSAEDSGPYSVEAWPKCETSKAAGENYA